MNLSNTIIPKSDQLNADDLIAGPRTIKITAVEAGSVEQPVSIYYEGDNGRPYKPSKSMRRVLVSIWGSEGAEYIGRSLTLYRDPNIKFGSDPVGGIRISHASHIVQPVQISLTETRGRRKPFRVEPLIDPHAEYIAQGEIKAKEGVEALRAWFTALPKPIQGALSAQKDTWKKVAEGITQ